MFHKMVLDRELAEALERCSSAEVRITAQRALIAKLEQQSADSQEAQSVLTSLEEAQRLHDDFLKSVIHRGCCV